MRVVCSSGFPSSQTPRGDGFSSRAAYVDFKQKIERNRQWQESKAQKEYNTSRLPPSHSSSLMVVVLFPVQRLASSVSDHNSGDRKQKSEELILAWPGLK